MKGALHALREPALRRRFRPRSSRRHASEAAFQICGLDHEFERFLAVDRDHRDALAVERLERRIAGDVDLLELERVALAHRAHDLERLLTEVTARLAVERQLRHATLKLRERLSTTSP